MEEVLRAAARVPDAIRHGEARNPSSLVSSSVAEDPLEGRGSSLDDADTVSPASWPGAVTGGVLLFDPVYSSSPLFRACRTGDHSLVGQFASLGSLDALLIESSQGHTPLTLAAMHGHEKVCVVLLDAGVGVDHETSRGYTALIEAVRGNHLSLVKLLVERFQALPRRINKLKVSALSEAKRRSHDDIYQFLFSSTQLSAVQSQLFSAILRHDNDLVNEITVGGRPHVSCHVTAFMWQLRRARRTRNRARQEEADTASELERVQAKLDAIERREQRLSRQGLSGTRSKASRSILAVYDECDVESSSTAAARAKPTGAVHARYLRKELRRLAVLHERKKVVRRVAEADVFPLQRALWVARLLHLRCGNGHTAFSWACAVGNLAGAELLLRRGSDPVGADVRFSGITGATAALLLSKFPTSVGARKPGGDESEGKGESAEAPDQHDAENPSSDHKGAVKAKSAS